MPGTSDELTADVLHCRVRSSYLAGVSGSGYGTQCFNNSSYAETEE